MDANRTELIPKGVLAHWMAERTGIWQMRILNQDELAGFVRARGLLYSFGLDIERLWQIGLLKADLVQSRCELDIPGLELVSDNNPGLFAYADLRDISFPNGLSSIIEQLPDLPEGIKLLFHPFRYYVLCHLDRNLKPSFHPMQQILSAEGYVQLLEEWQRFFDRRTSEPDLPETIRYWESVAEIAIATEPYLYERLFGLLVSRYGVDFDAQRRAIEEHWKDVIRYYKAAGVEQLERVRQNLCMEAERLDPNKTVHTILRLTIGEQRIKRIEGSLGGSMLLLTMAEMLRRATEDVFGVQLPEEDEKGFGIPFPDTKEKLYGSRRILDDESAANAFLRFQGLDYGVRVRWYVEGDTEYYALQSVLTNFPAIELINLRGRVVEGQDRGLSFRDSLRSDIRAARFSCVLLDADREDYVRAVRKAAEDDEICGAFYLSDPDFEFGNFTLAELTSVLWQIAQDNGPPAGTRPRMEQALRSCTTGKELLSTARGAIPELAQVEKGADWGKRLMQYAVEHPEWTKADSSGPQPRPIVEALHWAVQATAANYRLSRRDLRVNPETGQPVERDSPD